MQDFKKGEATTLTQEEIDRLGPEKVAPFSAAPAGGETPTPTPPPSPQTLTDRQVKDGKP